MHRLFLFLAFFSLLLSSALSQSGNESMEEPPSNPSTVMDTMPNLQPDTMVVKEGAVAPGSDPDSIVLQPILFTPEEASDYLIRLMENDSLWIEGNDTLQRSLSHLLYQYQEPFDTIRSRLIKFEYDSIQIENSLLTRYDTVPVRWLNDSTFIADTIPLAKEPFFQKKTIFINAIDTTALQGMDTVPLIREILDSIELTQDTIIESFIDTTYLQARNLKIHQFINQQIIPPFVPPGSNKTARFFRDSTRIVITENIPAKVATQPSPFFVVPDHNMPDSLKQAVGTLLNHTYTRDSVLVNITDMGGQRMPFWLSAEKDEVYRYWVKNNNNDSITLWIGNPSKFDVSLTLEENVNVERLRKKMAQDFPVTSRQPQTSLLNLKPLKEIPVYWNYAFSSAFILNQTFLSNWSKGGENSLSSMLDIHARAEYNNKAAKTQWSNNGRLRYGTIVTEEHGFRSNTDMLEFNSKFNKELRPKMDFSSVFYMKTQVAKGYNFPNDSVVISRFLNPATLTIGTGVEYEPFKKTRLNLSPLSYKNTFALDTANIDQTAHGIDAEKRARQEMGGQLVINSTVSILEDMNISNNIRLFSNYLEKPQNVDVDWELGIEKQISWFFMIRLNLHMIYDDDIKFPVLDENDEPVILPDGTEKKSPKLQFKQYLGLTLSFKL
ncbi:MAG: DUF3078 domain-containing protein [Bacteroidales bacterium]